VVSFATITGGVFPKRKAKGSSMLKTQVAHPKRGSHVLVREIVKRVMICHATIGTAGQLSNVALYILDTSKSE
jgi:hypothetical protein